MKKVVLIILCIFLIFGGCTYQAKLRPKRNGDEIWVCEKPHIELCWNKINGCDGKMIIDGVEQQLYIEADYGASIWLFTPEAEGAYGGAEQQKFLIFRGRVDYGKDILTVKVQTDPKNIFNGELPTLEFKRYNKEEYFKEYQRK